jgi:hypothetical protein
VDLVVVGGRAQYGRSALMAAAGSAGTTSLRVDGQLRAMLLTRPDESAGRWEWDDVVARLEQVRANPKRAIERGRSRRDAAMAAVYVARSRNGEPMQSSTPLPPTPLRLALDMPTGLAPLGGLPKTLTEIVVPELAGLSHDTDLLDSIVGRGYHGGLLDDLAGFYR